MPSRVHAAEPNRLPADDSLEADQAAVERCPLGSAVGLLKDPTQSVETRIACAHVLRDEQRDGTKHRALRFTDVHDDDSENRIEAVFSALMLVSKSSSPAPLRREILWILGEFPDAKTLVVTDVALLLQDPDQLVQQYAARLLLAMAERGRSMETVRQQILTLMTSTKTDRVVRRHVAQILARTPGWAPVPFRRILQNVNEDKALRRIAAVAVAALWKSPVGSSLPDDDLIVPLLHANEDPEVLRVLLGALRNPTLLQGFSPNVVRMIGRTCVDLMDGSGGRATKLEAIQTLAALGAPGVTHFGHLRGALSNQADPVVRAAVAQTMLSLARGDTDREMQALQDFQGILRRGGDELWPVREAAATALGVWAREAFESPPARSSQPFTTVNDRDERRKVHETLSFVFAHDIDPKVRTAAAISLGQVRELDAQVTTQLVAAIGDPTASVASAAVAALKYSNPNNTDTIAALGKCVEADDDAKDLRGQCAATLGALDSPGVERLGQVLANQQATLAMRRVALAQLAHYTKDNTGIAPILIEQLSRLRKERETERAVVGNTIVALGKTAGNVGVTELLDVAQRALSYRTEALEALETKARTAADNNDTTALAALQVARSQLENDGVKVSELMNRSLTRLETFRRAQFVEAMVNRVAQDPALLSGLSFLLLVILWNLFAFVFKPIWIHFLSDWIDRTIDGPLSITINGVTISGKVKYLVGAGFLQYSHRVLDAWIVEFAPTIRKKFNNMPRVSEQKVYVDIPLLIGGEHRDRLETGILQPIFAKERGVITIFGEGGSGKTALACQLAKMAMAEPGQPRLRADRLMVPVLIDGDLPRNKEGKLDDQTLLEAVAGRLSELTGLATPPSTKWVEKLFEKGLLLLLVDRLSELSSDMHKLIDPTRVTFPARYLIVTSRQEVLTDRDCLRIEPKKLGENLGTFFQIYASKFDISLGDAQSVLKEGVKALEMGRHKKLTILLAKLYADHMIQDKRGAQDARENGPANVPQLMLGYLNILNGSSGHIEPHTRGDRLQDGTLHTIVKIVARQCVAESSFLPTAVNRRALEKALVDVEEIEPAKAIQYLEERLRIIVPLRWGEDQLNFSLDPLAVYMAGLKIVDELNAETLHWDKLLHQMRLAVTKSRDAKDFVYALHDCLRMKDRHGNPVVAIEYLHDLESWMESWSSEELDHAA